MLKFTVQQVITAIIISKLMISNLSVIAHATKINGYELTLIKTGKRLPENWEIQKLCGVLNLSKADMAYYITAIVGKVRVLDWQLVRSDPDPYVHKLLAAQMDNLLTPEILRQYEAASAKGVSYA
jgi:hypothetical protein